MNLIKKYFGEQLKNIRNAKNLTQEKLSEGIGINQRQLARIEAGHSFVTAETLGRICTFLDIEPEYFFSFKYLNECLMTGTDNKMHFSVIKSGNIIQVLNNSYSKTSVQNIEKVDLNMQKMASKLKKDIIVEEIIDGEKVGTRIYKPNGQVEIKYEEKDDIFQELKEKIYKIKNDKNKIEFLKMAIDAFDNKNSLEQLKFMIKGLEITIKT